MRRGGSRPTWQSCSFRDWRISERVLRELNHRGHKLIQAAGSHEPATTIRTPSEMDNSVSMGGRNIACVVPRDIPGARCFHHRNTCHCCACLIRGAYHACQRQGCELKKLIRRLPTRRGELRRISPRFGSSTSSVTGSDTPLPVINKSKRMVGILSLGDVSHSAPAELLLECIKNVSAHH